MSLRIAIAGTGYIANLHAKAASSIADVQLVAVVNHKPDSRSAFAWPFNTPPHADGPEAATQLYGLSGFGQLFPTYLWLPAEGKIESGFPATCDPHCPQSMYDAQLVYFVDCVRNHRTPHPGGAEGLVNVNVVDAAYESARTGQVVQIR